MLTNILECANEDLKIDMPVMTAVMNIALQEA